MGTQFRNPLLILSLFTAMTACNPKKSDSYLMTAESCPGFDINYIKEGILGPSKDVAGSVKNSMSEEEYNTRYSNDSLKERAVCEVATLLRGSAKDAGNALTAMALGFAKKAALRYLDGFTFGLASSFGDKSGAASLSAAEVKNIVETVVNEALDRDAGLYFMQDFKAFNDGFRNNGNTKVARDWAYLSTIVGKGKALDQQDTLLFERQTNLMTDLRDKAYTLLNSRSINSLNGSINYKIAKPYQLILGMYFSLIKDLNIVGLSDGIETTASYLAVLDNMDKALMAEVEAQVKKPSCSQYAYSEFRNGISCEFNKVGFRIGRDYGACAGETCDKAEMDLAQKKIDAIRDEDVQIIYQERFLNYFGTSYVSFMEEMHKNIGLVYARTNYSWVRVTGFASDIAVANTETAAVIGEGQGIYYLQGGSWANVSGTAVNIDIAPSGSLWVVNANNDIYRNDGGGFYQLPGKAQDISVGANGVAWVTTPASDGIYRWNGSDWDNIPGSASRISVGPDGNAVVVTIANDIYRYNGQFFEQMPGKARDVGVGADGSIFIIGVDAMVDGYGVWRWAGNGWQKLPSAAGVAIDVDAKGNPWIVNNKGDIYRSTKVGT